MDTTGSESPRSEGHLGIEHQIGIWGTFDCSVKLPLDVLSEGLRELLQYLPHRSPGEQPPDANGETVI